MKNAAQSSYESQPIHQRDFNGLLITAQKFQAEGRLTDAIFLYRQALTFTAPTSSILLNLGSALHDTGLYNEALVVYDQAIAINGNNGKIWHNRGNTLLELDCYEEAIDSYEYALSLMNDDVGALVTIGTALERLGRYDQALIRYQEALALDPACAEAHWNLALAYLRQGNYKEGWREFEWRWQKRGYTTTTRSFSQPVWEGGALDGKTILIHAEQAFGDTLQFVRYLPYVAQRGGKILFECPAPLVSLLIKMPAVHTVIAAGQPLPCFDCHLPLLSLPLLFDTVLDTIPRAVPYLKPPGECLEQWQKRTPHDQSLKVGLVWAGRKYPDRHRSCRLSDFAPLADLPGITFYSLQIGEEAEQATTPPEGMELIDLTGNIQDFADTAAFVAQLDLVISIDTAMAHLAGCLGKPIFLLASFAPDWRWGLSGSDSPWYPTMSIFRQKKLGDWSGVMNNLRQALQNRECSSDSTRSDHPGQSSVDSSLLRLYFYQEGKDFFLSPAQKSYRMPLIAAPPTGMIQVDDPFTADFFVFPFDLTPLQNFVGFDNTLKFIQSLSFFESFPDRHVFYSSHDDYRTFPVSAIFFKTSVIRENLTEKIIAIPFSVEDFAEQLSFDANDIPYATSFVGYPGSSQLREKLLYHVAEDRRLRAFFDLAGKFHYHLTTDEMKERRSRYVASLRNSLTVLCPRGDGVNSIRFFETLSMGRIPILIADICLLPGEDFIPYSEIMLCIPENKVEQAGELIHDWLAGQSPAQLLDRCRKARAVWERYFSPAGIARLMMDALGALNASNAKNSNVENIALTAFATLYQQGCAAYHTGHYTEAKKLLKQACTIIPSKTETWLMRGLACYALGNLDEAELLFLHALELDNNCIDVYRSIGLLLTEQNRFTEAADILMQGLAHAPNNVDLVRYLGHALQGCDRYSDAVHWYNYALILEPGRKETLLNLGVTCETLNRHAEAEVAFRQAAEIDPADYRPYLNLGGVYLGLNLLSEAEACYQHALRLSPGQGTALWNIAQITLLRGDYGEGFKQFESRFEKKEPVIADLQGLPRCDGHSLKGKSILVVNEQAFGDTLQFCRFIPLLAERGATVYLLNHLPQLNGLLASLPGLTGIINPGTTLPPCDCGIPLLSLAMLLGTTIDTIPLGVPYLMPQKKLVEAWWGRLLSDQQFKIGIVWKGRNKPDPRRSTALSLFAPLAIIPKISWYSLQMGEGADQAKDCPPGMLLNDMTDHIRDFEDTAAFLMNLDLIITIDSAVAHLAGALGRPVWVMLPFAPDWRWMLERADSPWYPGMRLFRQSKPGDWEGLFANVADALRKVAQT